MTFNRLVKEKVKKLFIVYNDAQKSQYWDTKISRALYLRALFSAIKLVYAFRTSTVECTMWTQTGNLDIGVLFSLSLWLQSAFILWWRRDFSVLLFSLFHCPSRRVLIEVFHAGFSPFLVHHSGMINTHRSQIWSACREGDWGEVSVTQLFYSPSISRIECGGFRHLADLLPSIQRMR